MMREYSRILTPEQQAAFTILKSGENVFLTGKAGSGKSFVLQKFIDYSREFGKQVLVTAYTGIAAHNIHGSTLHRAFKMNKAPQIHRPSVDEVPSILRNLDIIIIDEISMVRMDIFDYVIRILSLAEEKYKRRIQLVVTGDFYQLPPVMPASTLKILQAYYTCSIGKGYAFQSPLWRRADFVFVELKEVIRQRDPQFVHALNRIRIGDATGCSWIKAHSSPFALPHAYSLVANMEEARRFNNSFMSELDPASERRYTMTRSGDVDDDDLRADENLILRKGAKVMILINDSSGGNLYYNGSYGTVTSLFHDSVNVQLESGIINFHKYTWESYAYVQDTEDPKKNSLCVVGRYSQIPLKPAWAISIHKSQGQTYSSINMDLSASWEVGHIYTALSRVKNLKNMYIHGIIPKGSIIASSEVKLFYSDPYSYKTTIKENPDFTE